MLFNDNIRALHEVIRILAEEPFYTNLLIMYVVGIFLGLIGAIILITNNVLNEKGVAMRAFINNTVRNWAITTTTNLINRTFDGVDSAWGWTQDKKEAAIEGVKNVTMATVLAACILMLLTIQLAEEVRESVVGKAVATKNFIINKKNRLVDFVVGKKDAAINFIQAKKDQVIDYIQAKKQERADRIAAAAAAVEKARLEQLNRDIVAAGGVTVQQAAVLIEEVEQLKAKVAKIEASTPARVVEIVDLRTRYSAEANVRHAVKVVRKAVKEMTREECIEELGCPENVSRNTATLRCDVERQRAMETPEAEAIQNN